MPLQTAFWTPALSIQEREILSDIGSQAVAMRTLYEYRMGIACLFGVRLGGIDCRKIQVPGTDSRYYFHHSGAETPVEQKVAVI